MPWPELGEIRRRCREMLNEHITTYFTDKQLNNMINDGEFTTAVISLGIEQEVAFSLVGGTRMYAAPYIRILGSKMVPTTGRNTSILRMTPQQLGRNVTRTTKLSYYFEWGKQVGFEPLPSTIFTAKVYAAAYPSVRMVADTDEPELPPSLIPYIIDYVLAQAAMKDRKLGTANFLMSKYVNNLMVVRKSVLGKYGASVQDMQNPTSYQVQQQA